VTPELDEREFFLRSCERAGTEGVLRVVPLVALLNSHRDDEVVVSRTDDDFWNGNQRWKRLK
jgi:hypothetical protein